MLIFEDPDKKKNVMNFVFDQGERYIGSLLVCDNPTCDCQSLQVQFYQPDHAEMQHELSFSLTKKSVNANSNNSEEKNFAQLVANELSEVNWSLLSKAYYLYKAYYSENISDFSAVKAKFQDVDPGSLVSYNDVLPMAQPFVIDYEDQQLIGYDWYCVNPGCNLSI